ncbi:MAG TPA: Cof-type HAD-IIB family hydrolase [Terriglobales bacterium]|nr:Cof-type HAD-IIB family hydrolase [Terriglobales bacterium]
MVSDVDGTLVTKDKRLTPAAIDAVRRIREAGIRFTIVSARPPEGLRVLAEPLQITEPMPAFNGGLIIGPDLKTILRDRLLDRRVVERLLQALDAAGVEIWVYTDVRWYVRDAHGAYVEHEQFAVKFAPVVVPDFREVRLDRVAKIVGVSEDFDRLAASEKQIQREFAGAVSATRSQKYYLDMTHPTANKGEGVLMLSELLGIPLSQIVTIGDMDNDISMFRQSGVSIAMGNASPEVKAQARFVTSSNEEDGFAKAMEQFVLGPRREMIAATQSKPAQSATRGENA